MEPSESEEECTVINISKCALTKDSVSVLSKGLTFAPTCDSDVFKTKVDLFRFYRNLHLKVWYHQNNVHLNRTSTPISDSIQDAKRLFKPKSNFMPMCSNPTLIAFTKKVSHDMDKMLENRQNKRRDNLSKSERDALNCLAKNDDIIVKPADKGGAVVVMDKSYYITEALRQLENNVYYERLRNNPIENMKNELKDILLQGKDQNWISDNEFAFLLNEKPQIPCFYMLPKVHKNLRHPEGRPIISGNGSLTEPCSQFVDYFIKPLVRDLPSFIEDTTDVLCKLREITDVSNCYMVTFDVASLYTNIDHQGGLVALQHYLSYRSDVLPPNYFLLLLTEWTLHNNVFLFQDSLYRQLKGTAMGACFAPNYANLFLGFWEEQYIYNQSKNLFCDKMVFWGRFIDDILLIWSGTESELLQFHEYLNLTNPNIKLSIEYSRTSISFLDLLISIDENVLHTSIYRKSTDRNMLLRADSFHTKSLKNNIPFGQFQRLRRICDKDTDFEEQAQDMKSRFCVRGYSPELIDNAIVKARSIPRSDLLKKKNKKTDRAKTTTRSYFVTQYNSCAQRMKRIITSNWKIMQSDPLLRRVFSDPPITVFQRAPTIKDKLVRSYLPAPKQKTWLQTELRGTYKCGSCKHCGGVVQSKCFHDLRTQREYKTNGFINCNSEYVVYCLRCPCGCFYVGRTKRKLKERFYEHKYAIRIQNEDYPMAKHYKDAHHSDPSSLKIQGIEIVKTSIRGGDKLKLLLQRETFWIWKLKAMEFPGLNEEIDYTPFL